MIRPFGKYLLVRLIEPEKKKGALILMNEEQDPLVKCELIAWGNETADWIKLQVTYVYFRRYELRDCIDKEAKLHLINEDCILGYE